MQATQTVAYSMRLFFALWPDRGLQCALERLARQQHEACGGRVMRGEGLHMTLLFLGAVSGERLPQLQAAAARVSHRPFSFLLRRFACWRHNHVGYVAPAEAVESLTTLVDALRQEVEDAGFSFDRRQFTPHVTLLRKIEHAVLPQELPPLEWRVREFALVVSETTERGSHYRLLARWPLQ